MYGSMSPGSRGKNTIKIQEPTSYRSPTCHRANTETAHSSPGTPRGRVPRQPPLPRPPPAGTLGPGCVHARPPAHGAAPALPDHPTRPPASRPGTGLRDPYSRDPGATLLQKTHRPEPPRPESQLNTPRSARDVTLKGTRTAHGSHPAARRGRGVGSLAWGPCVSWSACHGGTGASCLLHETVPSRQFPRTVTRTDIKENPG